MKTFVYQILFVFILLTQVWQPTRLDAQTVSPEDAPAFAVVVQSANALLNSVDVTANKINEPAVQFYSSAVRVLLEADGPLGGFDLNRPVALIIDPNLGAGALFPVQNWDTIQNNLKQSGAKLTPTDDKCFKLEKDNNTSFLLLENGWLAVSSEKEQLFKNIPQKTLDFVTCLSKERLVSIYLNSRHVPEEFVKEAGENLQNALHSLISDKISDQNELQATVQDFLQSVTDMILQSLQNLYKDKAVLVGSINFDSQKGFVIEIRLELDTQTQTAKELLELQNTQTPLAGFYSTEAAFSFMTAGKYRILSSEKNLMYLKTYQKFLENNISEHMTSKEQSDKVSRSLDKLSQLIVKTAEDGNKDVAVSLFASPEQGVTLIGATYNHNGYELETILSTLLNQAVTNRPEITTISNGIKRDIAKINGVNVHSVTFILPKEAKNYEAWTKLLKGDKITVAFGFGHNVVCAGAGTDAINRLKTALENSSKPQSAPLFQYQIQYGKLAQSTEEFYPMSDQQRDQFKQFKKSMGKQYNLPCQKSGKLFIEQKDSICSLIYRENIPFETVKFGIKYAKKK